MKKSKKLLSALLALVLAVTSFPLVFNAVGDTTVATAADTNAEYTKDVGMCTPGTANQRTYAGKPVSLINALYKFHDNGNGTYEISNDKTGTKVYLNTRGGNTWSIPNYSSAGPMVVETSNKGADQVILYSNASGADGLVFGKSNGSGSKGACDRIFDRVQNPSKSALSTTTVQSALNGTNLDCSAFYLYRRAKVGEQSSQELQGFVKLQNGKADIVSDQEYIIATKYYDGTYYVLYPSTAWVQSNQEGQGPTHVAKVGTPVTGVVDYGAGVIYTQGSKDNFASFGTTISEGTLLNGAYGNNNSQNWYKTAYTLANGWTIDHITVLDGIDGNYNNTNVRAESGILKGKISFADASSNNTTTIYQKLLVDTYLKKDGKTYVQHDYLWGTTTPVPSQMITYAGRWRSGTQMVYAPMCLVGKGSTSVYSINDCTVTGGDGRGSMLANSVGPFRQDTMQFGVESKSDMNKLAGVINTGADKKGGYYAWVQGGGTNTGTVTGAFTGPKARYYYDYGSPYNPGFTQSNSGSATFQVVINKPNYVATNSSPYQYPGQGTIDFNEVSLSFNSTSKYWWQQNAQKDTAVQKFVNYVAGSANGLQIVNCSVTMPNGNQTVTGRFFCKTSHDYGNNTNHWTVNGSTLPIEVKVDVSKVQLRQQYNACKSSVRIASDYTPQTWHYYAYAMMEATQYLNNYNVTQNTGATQDYLRSNIVDYNNKLTKNVDLSGLESAIQSNASLYNSEFPTKADGSQEYSVDSWNSFKSAYESAKNLVDVTYGSPAYRLETAGYGAGAANTSATSAQQEIDAKRAALTLEPPANDDTFEAAVELADGIDLDAYKDDGTAIKNAVTTGTNAVYAQINGKTYIRPSQSSQSTVDSQVTAILTAMNVAGDSDNANDLPNNKGKNTVVDIYKNGNRQTGGTFKYGTQLMWTVEGNWGISTANLDTLVCEVHYIYDTANNTETVSKISLNHVNADNDNKKALYITAKCPAIKIYITYDDSASVIVRDYFDVSIYKTTTTSDKVNISEDGKTLTINGTTVEPKPSPAFKFVKWIKTEENGKIIVRQQGTRIGGSHTITAMGGTVTAINDLGQEEPNVQGYKGFNSAYIIRPDGATPAGWMMEVKGKDNNVRTYLASYETTFTRFVSDYDVKYTALDAGQLAQLFPKENGKPVSYGDAFKGGDNQDKFTLSCFYALPVGMDSTKVTETGILYSTDGSLTPATMTTDAAGVVKRMASNVSNYHTYTMTKTNANTGTHLMRSYISYLDTYDGKTVIRVSYGPVYKCVNGQISIVE